MSVDPNELSQWKSKQVILHTLNEDGDLIERTGKIEDASSVGVAFKEKGKRDVDLVMPDQIEEIAAAPTKPRLPVQKTIKAVEENKVRQHLADRHGYTMTQVKDLKEEDAASLHDRIDHSDLGHKHKAADDDSEDEDSGDDE